MNEGRDMSKRILAEFLGFLKYKVEHDGMTLPDMQALLRVIEQIPVYATADEIADEIRMAMFLRDYIDDPDGNPTRPFDEFYINCIAKGVDIPWEDMI